MSAAVEAPPAVVPASVGSAVPSSKGEIHVTPASVEAGKSPLTVNPARERLSQDLRKKFAPETPVAPPAATPPKPAATPPKPAAAASAVKEGDAPPETPAADGGETPPAEATAPISAEEKKKVSPWKLVEQFKAKALAAEQRALDLEKNALPEDKRKELTESFTALKKRADELEEEIKYVNYSKSKEFQEKHQAPYEKAWARAMGELKELTLTDATGNPRAMQPSDLLELVNLPLVKAQDLADEVFGKFSPVVMSHRKEIRALFESQAEALEAARKNGSAREQQTGEQLAGQQKAVREEIGKHWTTFNDAAAKDERYGKYFTPAEGDEEGNAKLEKGFKLVDQAFAENPFAPNLKPEQRADIIKRHAAVRNRAAAFGRLVHSNAKLESRVAELTKELEQFKGSTPSVAGSTPNGIKPAVSARESVFGALHKLAK